MPPRRSLLAVVLAASLTGCAHRPDGVVRLVDGQPVSGRVVSALGYESALRLALDVRGVVTTDDRELARRAIAANPGDEAVLALAIEAAPDDAVVLGAAESLRGRSCSIDVALARPATPRAAALAALVGRCREAVAPAIDAARSEGDTTTLAGLVDAARGRSEPVTVAAVLGALVALGQPEPLEAFVRSHRDDPSVVARAAALASSTDAPLPPAICAALLGPLTSDDGHAVPGVLALVRAHRDEDARDAVMAAPTLAIDDAVALAELADGLGMHARALELADDARDRGASTRADAVAAHALRALGRNAEADARMARIVPDTAGASLARTAVTDTP